MPDKHIRGHQHELARQAAHKPQEHCRDRRPASPTGRGVRHGGRHEQCRHVAGLGRWPGSNGCSVRTGPSSCPGTPRPLRHVPRGGSRSPTTQSAHSATRYTPPSATASGMASPTPWLGKRNNTSRGRHQARLAGASASLTRSTVPLSRECERAREPAEHARSGRTGGARIVGRDAPASVSYCGSRSSPRCARASRPIQARRGRRRKRSLPRMEGERARRCCLRTKWQPAEPATGGLRCSRSRALRS